jgi:hypothetical protein
MHTLQISGLSQEHARFLPKYDGPVNGGDVRGTMAQVTFKLVHVIHSFSATACMLRVDRVYSQPSRTDAKDEWILFKRCPSILGK